MKILGALAFASLAAVGNALFAGSQRKIVGVENGLTFVTYVAGIAALLAFAVAPLFGAPDYGETMRTNWRWIVLSGSGLFVTNLGFYLLYTNYGTSFYVLYAVLAIITTSVLVGVVYFKEPFNAYQWAALICALAAVLLFTIGQRQG